MAKITLKEWAKREGITDATARQKAIRGSLKTAEKIGKQWFIEKSELNMDNRMKDENVFYVIESYKGSEEIVFAGSESECLTFENSARIALIRANGDDITAVNDFYTQSKVDREKNEKRRLSLEEYSKNLSKEELAEIVEINGKKYAKWILEFNKLQK
ncbi:hypothetical protein ABGF26_02565 [Helcococcus ovis]|uniref:hypothetical protein n=1 Tax=Helcococcus ovis TaxID=72026 RepID=UPI0038B7F231